MTGRAPQPAIHGLFREEAHELRVGSTVFYCRSLVAGDWTDDSSDHHVLVSGYTLSAEILLPLGSELLVRGAAVRIVDPFTMLGFRSCDAVIGALRSPEDFLPSAYARRLATMWPGAERSTTLWAESFGAHVALRALLDGLIVAERVVLLSPNGLRQSVGPPVVDRVASLIMSSPRAIATACRLPLTRGLRSSLFQAARRLVGGLTYDSPFLSACREVITKDSGAFASAMFLPLLGINHDLLTEASLESTLADRAVTLVQPRNDLMLRYEVDERGRRLRGYQDAWEEIAEAAGAASIRVAGGHEAVFEPGFAAERLVDLVLASRR